MINRKDVHEDLTSRLGASLAGVGLPAQAVYGYKKKDFQGQSPVVLCLSGGSNRPLMTARGSRAEFAFEIWLLALYSDRQGSYYEKDAEDTLDTCEYALAQVVDNFRGPQRSAAYAGASTIANLVIGGDTYMWEMVPVTILADG